MSREFTSPQSVRNELAAIERSIADGTYRKGEWQALVVAIDRLDVAQKRAIAPEVSRVSRALHARNRFHQLPFRAGLALELVLLVAGLVLLGMEHILLVIAGIGALALSLQPTIKVLAGLVLGVRYDYVYLWHFEPRFKMQYGGYLGLSPGVRVLFHLTGAIGTPLAMLLGFLRLLPVNQLMAYVCLAACIGAFAMQVGAFAAEWMGVRNIGGYRLSTLTSPATAAFELKKHLGRA